MHSSKLFTLISIWHLFFKHSSLREEHSYLKTMCDKRPKEVNRKEWVIFSHSDSHFNRSFIGFLNHRRHLHLHLTVSSFTHHYPLFGFLLSLLCIWDSASDTVICPTCPAACRLFKDTDLILCLSASQLTVEAICRQITARCFFASSSSKRSSYAFYLIRCTCRATWHLSTAKTSLISFFQASSSFQAKNQITGRDVS